MPIDNRSVLDAVLELSSTAETRDMARRYMSRVVAHAHVGHAWLVYRFGRAGAAAYHGSPEEWEQLNSLLRHLKQEQQQLFPDSARQPELWRES